jgi:hypothetical protein
MLPLAFCLLVGASAGAGAQNNNGSYAWPYLIVSGRDSIWLYQPQGITWSNGQLQASEAVAIRTAGENQEKYGVVWFQASTNDAGNGKVTLSNYAITKQNFPSMADNGSALTQTIASNAGALPVVNQQKLKDDISLGNQNPTTEQGGPGVQVKNDPPAIIHSSDPALLILVDGDPTLTSVPGTNYQRIINSNYLILTDGSGNYFTPVGDKWAVTSDLNNANWSVAPNVDPLNDAKSKVQADKNINLSIPDTSADEVRAAFANGTLPMMYVATRPTELLVTNGDPDFEPISGTNLLYAQNAKGDLFKDVDDNRTYTLLSGRWYSAPDIAGPWTWVDPSQLPADFSKIPQNLPQARVLTSVPNTSQANEALIANTIPQTATVTKSEANFSATYDGDPHWKAIPNTNLSYAPNASAPVIRDGDEFYACDKAVWFESSSPMGPWTVCSQVPDEIYNIPSNSPVYNVTYVKVYDADADDVTFGYTPGYFGVYDSYWGCPVYGTGWWYRPWIGSYWYGAPWTFGYGAGFGWGPYYGYGAYFNFGFGFYSPIYRPWWGPWGWYHPYGLYGGWYGHGGVFANHINIYNSWGNRGFVHVNANPIGRIGGGAGLYRPGARPVNINRVGYSRGSIYGGRTVNGGIYRNPGTVSNPHTQANGFAQNRTIQQNRTYQSQAQNRNFQPQQRSVQPQQRVNQARTFQPQRQAPARTYSAPAFHGGGGGGGFHGGGGGGGSRGGGGGGHGGRH